MSGSVLLALSSLFSRLLGIIRTNQLALIFGAGSETDAYFAAFTITDFIYNLIVFGAISAAFVPIFSNYLAQKDFKNAWIFTNNLLNFLLLVVIGASMLIFILATPILTVLYPGFDEPTLTATVHLTRIMLLAPLFFGISGILSSIQNAYHTFLAYSLSPILYNLSIILGLIYLSPIYGIYGVAYGVVIGAFLHMAVQIPVVLRQGYRYAWILNLKRSDFIQTIKLALPRTLGLAVFQINFIVEGFIASTIAYGSLTIFRFAQDLQSFPVGIVGVSLAISSFGVLSKHAAKKQYDKIAEMVSSNIRKIIFLSIPASAGLLALRDNIISLILQYGKFSPEAALTTSLVLGIFCVSLTFLSLIPLLSRAFYALQDTKTPVKIGIITIIINLGLGLTLSYFQGIIGLALASVIAASFNFIALFSKLKTKFIQFNLKNNLLEAQYVLRVLSAAAIMGFFVFYLNQQLGQLNLLKNITQEILSWCTANPTLYFWPGLIFLQTLIATGTGIIIYGGFTLRLDENRLLLGKFGIRKTNQQ